MEEESRFVRGNTYEVDIPLGDGVGRPPVNATALLDRVLSLDGRTFEEVQEEASQIRLGGIFCTFVEFVRCIDSWGVLHHRSVVRYKTAVDLAIRSYRFGNTVRKYTRTSQANKLHSSDSESEDCQGQDTEDDNPVSQVADITGIQGEKENSFPSLTRQQIEDSIFEDGIRALSQNVGTRQVLGPLQVIVPSVRALNK